VTPPVQRLLRHFELLRRSCGRRALTCKALRFMELSDDLFKGLPSGLLWSPPPIRASGSHIYRTSSTEADQ
jgi:hypothetical protein